MGIFIGQQQRKVSVMLQMIVDCYKLQNLGKPSPARTGSPRGLRAVEGLWSRLQPALKRPATWRHAAPPRLELELCTQRDGQTRGPRGQQAEGPAGVPASSLGCPVAQGCGGL